MFWLWSGWTIILSHDENCTSNSLSSWKRNSLVQPQLMLTFPDLAGDSQRLAPAHPSVLHGTKRSNWESGKEKKRIWVMSGVESGPPKQTLSVILYQHGDGGQGWGPGSGSNGAPARCWVLFVLSGNQSGSVNLSTCLEMFFLPCADSVKS